MEPLISYNHVTIAYNGTPSVHDVSLDVAPGEIVGIVGESGSGKSTLIKAPMGLLGSSGAVTAGSISYKGEDLATMSGSELRRLCGPELGMVFQDCAAALNPIRTVGTQIYEAVAAHESVSRDEVHARALEMLGKLGLDEPQRVFASYPFELSGGMSQRVGLGIAMLMRPAVLFADEPTSALDVSVQKQVVDELLAMREEFGTSIVIVTHNMGVVRAMCDRVLVLRQGRVDACGTREDVLEKHPTPYTRELLDAVPRLRR